MKPVLLQFDKENINNDFVTFNKKMKPQINLEDDFTESDYDNFFKRHDEIKTLLQNAIYEHFLNENNRNSYCYSTGDFPDRRILTGNYYIGSIDCSKSIMDEDYYYEKKGDEYQALSSPDGKHYPFFEGDEDTLKHVYIVIIGCRLTSLEDGIEDDYLGIDFRINLENFDDKIELEILSTNVI